MSRLVLATILLAAMPMFAQSSAEVNAGIQFNFASPGARSLARGGAFIADASDATAAYANPAGLVNLPAGEVSLELRVSEFTHEFTDRGHALAPPPAGRVSGEVTGLQSGTSMSRIDNVAFGSVVVPAGRFTLAAYRHELANFAASARTQGAFFDLRDEETGEVTTLRHYPAVSSLRLRINGVGLSAATRITDRLAIGAGVRRYDSEIDSTTERYRPDGFSGPPDYTALDNVQTQRGSGHSIGVNAGILFDVSRSLSIGASYRQGFSFPVEVTYVTIGFEPETPKTAHFNVPTFYGLGASIRPTRHWSIAVDVNRITYSDLARDFVLLFQDEPRYFVPDGTEIRVGSEFIITRDRMPNLPFPIALSIGGWRDPDHAVRVSDPTDSQSVLFRPSSDQTHVSFGVGMIFDTHMQLHAAVDHAPRQTVYSLSMMSRFRR
jgi:long-chain fatty acid transport protein